MRRNNHQIACGVGAVAILRRHLCLFLAFSLVVALTARPGYGYSSPYAMEVLESQFGRHTTVETLAEILNDKSNRLRLDAVRAAGELRGDAKSLVPLLIAALDDDDWRIRCNAASALADIGQPSAVAVPALIRALDDKHEFVSNIATVAIGSIGPAARAAVPALNAILRRIDRGDGPENIEPWLVAESLGKIGPGAKDAVPVLISILRQRASSNDLRREAASALGAIVAAPNAGVLDAVTTAARLEAGAIEVAANDSATPEEALVRIAAALSLWKLGREPRVIPWLIATATRETNAASVREAAVKAIADIGPEARAAVPALVRLLDNWKHGTTVTYGMEAIKALGKIGGDAKVAIPGLVKHLDLKYGEGMSTTVVEALGDIGPAASAALPMLVQAMGISHQIELSGHATLRVSAVVAIRKIGGETAPTVPVLVEILAIQETWCFWSHFAGVREGAELRREAANALGDLGPSAKAAVSALRTLATDDFVTVREAADQALRQIEREPTP